MTLANHGGPTPTLALLPGSPAIQRGPPLPPLRPPTSAASAATASPNIGAFEFVPPPAARGAGRPVPLYQAGEGRQEEQEEAVRCAFFFSDTGAMKAEILSPFQQATFRAIVARVAGQ